MLNRNQVIKKAVVWGIIANHTKINSPAHSIGAFCKFHAFLTVLDLPHSLAGNKGLTQEAIRVFVKEVAASYSLTNNDVSLSEMYNELDLTEFYNK